MNSTKIGGVFAGLAGLSGAPLVIWATLRGWSKVERRSLFQMYNLTILGAMLAANAGAGRMPNAFLATLAIALPATIAGVVAGAALYRRLSDRGFDRVVLWLLLVAGLGLIASNLGGVSGWAAAIDITGAGHATSPDVTPADVTLKLLSA